VKNAFTEHWLVTTCSFPERNLFGGGARLELGTRLPELPEHSREAVEQELATLDFLETQIESAEKRVKPN